MTCHYCQEKFTPARSTAKFCSAKCRLKFMRAKNQDSIDAPSVTDPSVSSHPKSTTSVAVVSKTGEALKKINALLQARGLPLIFRASDYPKIEFVSSNIPEIDAITGGFPRSRITEIFGLKGVGKTALMSRIVATPDLKIFYIDTENALNFLAPNIDLVTDNLLEGVEEIVAEALQGDYDLIVIDSLASLVPRQEEEGESGAANMGTKAKLMSQWMRRIIHHLRKSQAAVVFINQQRESMNPYGPTKFTPGGFAVPYAASLRLELKTNKADRFEGGHWVNVEVEKSRVCKPYQKTKFKLLYA